MQIQLSEIELWPGSMPWDGEVALGQAFPAPGPDRTVALAWWHDEHLGVCMIYDRRGRGLAQAFVARSPYLVESLAADPQISILRLLQTLVVPYDVREPLGLGLPGAKTWTPQAVTGATERGLSIIHDFFLRKDVRALIATGADVREVWRERGRLFPTI